MQIPRPKLTHISYRSYKSFDGDVYKRDVSYAPFHVSEIFEDIDDVYWFNECLLSRIVNTHAPLKRKKLPKQSLPFMNSQLRKMIHQKAMHRNKYFKMGRTQKLWEQYQKSRNIVTKLKTKSMNDYFDKKM